MTVLVLENIRSAFNVGSIFRSADAIASVHLALVGYTPCPIDRMGRENTHVQKTALGAECSVPWQSFQTTQEALAHFTDCTPFVVERTATARPYHTVELTNPLFIFGNEVTGVSEETRSLVTEHIFLPMGGVKRSLNVATCATVLLYHNTYTQRM